MFTSKFVLSTSREEWDLINKPFQESSRSYRKEFDKRPKIPGPMQRQGVCNGSFELKLDIWYFSNHSKTTLKMPLYYLKSKNLIIEIKNYQTKFIRFTTHENLLFILMNGQISSKISNKINLY